MSQDRNARKQPASQNNPAKADRAYTGKTIVEPQSKARSARQPAPPKLPEVPPVEKRSRYTNPPPSQRKDKDKETRRPSSERRGSSAAQPAAPPAAKPARPRPTPQPEVSPAHPEPSLQRPLWRRVRRALSLVSLVVVALVLLLSVLLWQQTRSVAASVVVPEVRDNPSLATPLLAPVNVLLVGVDERPDHPEEGVRSDTLILARLSGAGRWVNLLSIPRDTQVELSGVGTTKINVAYGYGYDNAQALYGEETTPQQGGMALAAETVERFLQNTVRVDYTAQINFAGFVGLIDALGGVTVDVPKVIDDYEYPTEDFGYMHVHFDAGPQQMDGERALIYVRTRHADSDFGRSQRQQQVFRAIVAELQARGWSGRVAALPGMLNSLDGEGEEGAVPPVLTTMPFDRPDIILGLGLLASGLNTERIGRLQLSPETVAVTEIGTNLLWEPTAVRQLVYEWQQPPRPAPPDAPGDAPPDQP